MTLSQCVCKTGVRKTPIHLSTWQRTTHDVERNNERDGDWYYQQRQQCEENKQQQLRWLRAMVWPPHQYADDTQIYGSCSPLHVDDLSSTISGCVNDVTDWMQSNRLQLNPGKTELLWCTTSRRQNRLPTATLTVGSSTVSPVSSVHDLGIFVDSDLVMRTHVSDGVALLCCIASAAQHSSPRLGDRLSVACYCFSTQPDGLR